MKCDDYAAAVYAEKEGEGFVSALRPHCYPVRALSFTAKLICLVMLIHTQVYCKMMLHFSMYLFCLKETEMLFLYFKILSILQLDNHEFALQPLLQL